MSLNLVRCGVLAIVVLLLAGGAAAQQQALLPGFDTPDQFAASLNDEQQTWAAFIRQHGISGD